MLQFLQPVFTVVPSLTAGLLHHFFYNGMKVLMLI